MNFCFGVGYGNITLVKRKLVGQNMKKEKYEILARKYRPKSFEEVVGQKHVVQTLSNALRLGKIGQAYLFSGMRGIGKTTVARILAKALNCVHGPTPTPCNECEFCQAITKDRAIDVLEIDGAASRRVEEARDLREGLQYQPLHSRYKVVIIDEVHMLTPEAFATLLKILEEPPSQIVFIFATTEAHKVPKTIVSRCQHFEFKRISQKDIVKHLAYIAHEEKISISQEGLFLIAEAAEGSLRDAESILDKAVSFAGNNISLDDLRVLLGTVPQKLLFEVSKIIFNGEAGEVFSLVDKLVESGYELINFYHQLIQHFRKLLLAKSLANFQDIIPVNEEEYQRYRKEASDLSGEELLRYLNALLKEEGPLKYSFQPRIYLETILVKLCHFGRLVALEDLIKTLAGEEGSKSGLLEAYSGEREKSFSPSRTGFSHPPSPGDLTSPGKAQRKGKRNQTFSLERESEKVMPTPAEKQDDTFLEKKPEKADSQQPGLKKSSHQVEVNKETTPAIHSFSPTTSSSFTPSPSPSSSPVSSSPLTPPSSSKSSVSPSASSSLEAKLPPEPSRARKLKDKLLAQALEDPQVQEFLEIFKAQVLSVQPLSSWSPKSSSQGIKAKESKKGVKK